LFGLARALSNCVSAVPVRSRRQGQRRRGRVAHLVGGSNFPLYRRRGRLLRRARSAVPSE